MAFQKDAGGIILDAILTDLGRERMAQGNFKVAKFSLGDDEIDYSFGSKKTGEVEWSISGTKLPPVLEAFSQESANINYGLFDFTSDDILYVPIIKTNSKVKLAASSFNDYFYICANKETAKKVKSDIGEQYVLQSGVIEQQYILIESGILIPGPKTIEGVATTFESDLSPTIQNKKAYILNMSLYDKYFLVYTDDRFVNRVLCSPKDSIFENDSNNNLYYNMGPLKTSVPISMPPIVDNFEAYRIEATDHRILTTEVADAGNEYTAFNGPRGTIFAINLKINDLLTSDSNSSANFRYSKFGSTNVGVFGGSNRYDFINSTIYVQGLSSNSRLQIPIRIIRFSGTS